MCAFERGRQPFGQLPGPHRDREQHRRGRRSLQQGAEQLDGRRVGPMNVVEHEHERPVRGEALQQLADGAVAAVALVLEGGARPVSNPESVGKTVDNSVRTSAPSSSSKRLEPADVLVECVDEDPEREIPLELGRRPRQREVPA